MFHFILSIPGTKSIHILVPWNNLFLESNKIHYIILRNLVNTCCFKQIFFFFVYLHILYDGFNCWKIVPYIALQIFQHKLSEIEIYCVVVLMYYIYELYFFFVVVKNLSAPTLMVLRRLCYKIKYWYEKYLPIYMNCTHKNTREKNRFFLCIGK